MIIASASKDDGTRLLLVGLSHENLARLVAGYPILKNLSELPGGWEGHLAIMVGETEELLVEQIEEASGG